MLQDEKKFVRRLKVGRAYHSPHMLSFVSEYTAYQDEMSIEINPPSETAWFSSVTGKNTNTLRNELKASYWIDNLVSPVLFKQAVEAAWSDAGPFDVVVEIGPHPSLRAPVQQIIQDMTDHMIPYTGLLQRGLGDLEALANGMGLITSHLGRGLVDLQAYETFLSHNSTFRTLQGLPPYSWNHSTDYWHESRYTRAVSHRSDTMHELLGHLTPDSSSREMRWRHSICPKEVPWLSGHRVQDQTVYPGAAFLVTVVEACLKLAKEQPISLIEVLDIIMGQALTFDDDDTPVEVVFTLSDIQTKDDPPSIVGAFNCSAAKGKDGVFLDSLAHGKFRILLGTPSSTALVGGSSSPTNLIDVDPADFYTSLHNLDYEFSGPFIALQGTRRKLGLSTGFLPGVNAPSMLIHPAMLDALFQSMVLAASAPNDGRMWAAHIPNHIDAVRVNPSLCEAQRKNNDSVRPAFETSCDQGSDMSFVLGSSNLFPEGSNHSMIAVEGVRLVALSRATADNDRVMFSSHSWGPASPDISTIEVSHRPIPGQYEFTQLLQRVAFFYLRKLEEDVPHDHPCRLEGPYTAIFNYASHTLTSFREGSQSLWHQEWEVDHHDIIKALLASGLSTPDSELLQAIGPHLADIATEKASPIDIGMQDDLLAKYYHGAFGMAESLDRLAQTVGQILHRHPRIRCLEVGAGTGTATKEILRENGFPFSGYTFTDISSGFFASAQASLGEHANSMDFKPLDISKDPRSQGFEPHSYDLIVASLVLHATTSLVETLENVRRLLKPGGYLIAIEIQKNIPAHIGAIFGAFPGWWLGANDGRLLSPCIDVAEWNDLLRKTGFSGCDSSASELDPLVHPATIFVSQAVDERISFLRDPFATTPTLSGFTIPRLILLGGESAGTSSLVMQLSPLLQPYCASIETCRHITELEALGIDSDTLVVSLVDLDQPLFEQVTEESWESLKGMLQQVGSLIWVTGGRLAEKPHSNMMVGLLRSALNEIPDIITQFLDFEHECQLDAQVLGSAVMQFAKAVKLKQEDNSADMVHTIEPELVFQDAGVVTIPRLTRERAMDDRYNASRRLIPTSIPIAEASISLGPAKSDYYVRKVGHVASENTNKILGQTVHVSHSLLMPLRVNSHSSLFWSIGTGFDTLAPVVALSLANEAKVCPEICVPIPGDTWPDDRKADFLWQLVLFQISSLLLYNLEDGDRVLMFEADPALAGLVQAEGQRRGVEVLCTSIITEEGATSKGLGLRSSATEKDIRALHPESVAVFVDFGVSGESRLASQRILRHLNAACRRETIESMFSGLTRAHTEKAREKFQTVLGNSVTAVASIFDAGQHVIGSADVIGLAEVNSVSGPLAYRSIVDWTLENQVPALTEPIDTHPLFLRNKTYWLVGLTGSLGLSLCEWMIRKGARNIVISSRNPKIESGWLNMIAGLGATVNVTSW